MLKKTIIFLLLFSCAALAFPGTINYQGILKDSSGNPLTGSYTVVFTIYDAASGGTAQWTETQTVSVEAGLYNVKLGSATPLTTTVFNEDTRYLGVKIGSDAEMTPRVALVSVPYAFRAGVADTVSGFSGSYVLFGTTEAQTTDQRYGLYVKSVRPVGGAGNYYGVRGISESDGFAAGIYGYASSPMLGYGVWGSCDTMYGVYGSTLTGVGVVGIATQTGDISNGGGYFSAYGNTAKGVYGEAGANGDYLNYGGYFNANGEQGRGVYGVASSNTSSQVNYGGYFSAHSTKGVGVFGTCVGNGAGAIGVEGSVVGTGVENYGGLFVTSSESGSGVKGIGTTNGIAVYVDSILYLKPRPAFPGPGQEGMMYYEQGVGIKYFDGTVWRTLAYM